MTSHCQQDNSFLSPQNFSLSEHKMYYWDWIRAQFNPRDIHLHGTRIKSEGARRSPFSPFNFFVCLLHFFSAAQSRKLGARERSRGCQATLRKSRGARAIIARVILPRVSERKAIRHAKLYTASLPEKREELAAKVAQKYRMAAERASGGFAIVSDTRDFCERRNFSKLFWVRVLWVLWQDEDVISSTVYVHV